MKQQVNLEKIYQLIDQKQYVEALHQLYNPITKEIYIADQQDENQVWYVVANLLCQLDQKENAKYAFEKAIASRDDDIDAYIGLSNILNEEKNHREAIQVLKKALLISQDDRLIYNYANNLFDQGYLLEALEQYQKVSDQNPELYQYAQKNLAMTKQLLGTLD